MRKSPSILQNRPNYEIRISKLQECQYFFGHGTGWYLSGIGCGLCGGSALKKIKSDGSVQIKFNQFILMTNNRR